MAIATESHQYDERTVAKSHADFLGILCSVSCAVHCAALPIAMSLLPTLASLHWLSDPLLHQVIAITSAIFVLQSIVPGLGRPSNSYILPVTATGLVVLFLAAFILPDGCGALGNHQHVGRTLLTMPQISILLGSNTTSFLAVQALLTPIGSTLLIAAHIMNIRARCCDQRSCG